MAKSNMIGSWAFLVGIILAVILGLVAQVNKPLVIILVLLGIIVGLFNVAGKETTSFLVSGVVLIIAAAFSKDLFKVVEVLGNLVQSLLAFIVPATIIVAVKNVFSLAKN